MTVENLHDAIGQLPGDLIAETDRRRNSPKKVIPWQRCSAMAACLVLILCGSFFFTRLLAPKGSTRATDAATAEAAMMQENMMGSVLEDRDLPAAAQAYPEEEAAPQEPIPTFAAAEGGTDVTCEHSHAPQEPEICIDHETSGWCGNMTVTLYWNGEAHTLSGSPAVTLTDILYFLCYSEENLCCCMAEFTVDTEMGEGYEVNLTEYFARFEGGQANLTEEQVNTLQAILDAF